jgi:hypothetical protein
MKWRTRTRRSGALAATFKKPARCFYRPSPLAVISY